MPVSRSLGDSLFELRILGNTHVRLFYCFYNDCVYVLHGVIKKTNAINEKDLKHAKELKDRFHSDNI